MKSQISDLNKEVKNVNTATQDRAIEKGDQMDIREEKTKS